MDDDDYLSALAFQLELEHQQFIEDELLRADPSYPKWLDQLEKRSED